MQTGISGDGQNPDGRVAVRLEPAGVTVHVPAGSLLEEAISQSGLHVPLPCGGQGRCGRCAVQVKEGSVRRRSTMRLSEKEIESGYALACQTLVNSDATVWLLAAEEKLVRTAEDGGAEKAAPEVVVCDHRAAPWVARYPVSADPPSMEDNTPDLERLQRELARAHDLRSVSPSLTALTRLPRALRDGEWSVVAEVEHGDWTRPEDHRLLNVLPPSAGQTAYGVAIDVGTTTIAVYLADLSTRDLLDQASAYNAQIACGEDVISRIMYARDPSRRQELQDRAVSTVNALIDDILERQHLTPDDLTVAVVAGNTTMTHLLLGLEPAFIRLEPYIGAAGRFPPVPAARLGLRLHPEAVVDCLPDVGAYVGGDITSGVLRTGMHQEETVTLFLDVGTNGEMVLGNSDWLITCACSAGPAFEGAGAASGMRALPGAIEEVWIDPATREPTITTIGDEPPRGLCGSGLIALLGELLVTGLISKSGRIVGEGLTNRVRHGENGLEYVVVWAAETATGERDIVIDETDIQNLMRAKAAVYAGAVVLCDSVGIGITEVERVLIGGSFGRHIDVEKAIQIGLLPDLPWERFTYLGNTSLQGAYLALTCREHRRELDEVAAKMTYLELSADNRFMDAFTSALFLPHTDERLFPSLARSMAAAHPGAVGRGQGAAADREGASTL